MNDIIVRTEKRIYQLETQKEIHELRVEHGMNDGVNDRVIASSDFWVKYLSVLLKINEAILSKLSN